MLEKRLAALVAVILTLGLAVGSSAKAAGRLGLAAQVSRHDLAQVFGERYPSIVIDARGSRGGNGDVAAVYLTVTDWLENYDLKSQITVLVDENGKRRILKLAQANASFRSRVKVLLPSEASLAPASLYLVMASPSGTYRYRDDLHNAIPLRPDATLIVQTVLGNTENENSKHPFATVENGGRIFDWGPAGLGLNESGLYTDSVAKRLRGWDFDQVASHLLQQLPTTEDDFSREALKSVVNRSKLQGSKIGLVYGISAEQTQAQFMSYLHGLAADTDQAYTLVTPSRFRAGAIQDETLKKKLRFLSSLEEIPQHAEPGLIYVIETKILPHDVFILLMALSMKNGMVPVGAGDGFLSAAIELGGPFVLTQVPWNRANITRVREILLELAHRYKMGSSDISIFKKLLERNFDASDFKTAKALFRYGPLFRLLKDQVSSLSDRFMEVALAAPRLKEAKTIPAVNDLLLQQSHVRGGRTADVTAGLSARPRPSNQCRDLFRAAS